MAFSLEFLHSDKDIPEFINYLYDNNYVVRPRSGDCCDIQLDRMSAVSSLSSDLFAAVGTYFIETITERELLWLDSCGRFSLPRYLGNRGRMAGRIVCEKKQNTIAMALFTDIKKYFRKNYRYQHYNGQARMSCYFAPHYLVLDQDYSNTPDPEDCCPGYLRIVCEQNSKRYIEDLLSEALCRYPSITTASKNWYPFWANPLYSELRVELMYEPLQFSNEVFHSLVDHLSGGLKGIRYLNNRYSISASVNWRLQELQQDPLRYRLYLAMDHSRKHRENYGK